MPWTQQRRIYAAEFKSGVIKIGITSMTPASRAKKMILKGERPVRTYFGERTECGFWPEWEMMARLDRIGTLFQGREWFTGVRFSVARLLVDQVSRMALAMQAKNQAARAA